MKKLLVLTTFIVALAFTTMANAQKFSGSDKSPMDIASFPSGYKTSDKTVRISYSRPKLKGRDAMELMTKNGPVWRTGANEAPEITFYKDVNFGGQDIKAGTYALLTIPGEETWTIILHNSLNEWGAYFYKESSDVARVTGVASTGDTSLEEFSIAFTEANNGAHMYMGWGKTRVSVPITW
ncbi:DUF2911 domain-containing protein [Maribacter sp. 2304DJ31-5]|uniref:DUF2911 domain-containing protein n=1 Tax=Maribacter sp. 2304DJ31-5 TaxID=3386273 RepID=UPI0039BD3A44